MYILFEQRRINFNQKDTKIMRISTILILFLSIVSSFAFFQADADATETLNNRILKFGVHVSAMGKLDPHFAAGSQDRAFADMVFNSLLRYEPGNAPKIEPDLAQEIPEFKLIGGKQVWTIHLRRGVMFHAGPKTDAYELTADDVVFSLNKSKNKKNTYYFHFHTFSSVFHVSGGKKAKLSSNGKANTVLPPGTRGVQPFLIGPGEPRATPF